jgi:hypothetical protein
MMPAVDPPYRSASLTISAWITLLCGQLVLVHCAPAMCDKGIANSRISIIRFGVTIAEILIYLFSVVVSECNSIET